MNKKLGDTIGKAIGWILIIALAVLALSFIAWLVVWVWANIAAIV